MNILTKLNTSKIIFILGLGLFSCKKEIDHPPLNQLGDKNTVTIKNIIDLYQGEAIEVKDTLSVFATVTMDQVDGNIYKNIYIKDQTGALNLRMNSAADLFVGDSIRVNILGATIDRYNGVMQISNIDPDNKIIKQAKGKEIEPKLMSIADIDTSLVNQLIILKGVQFSEADLNGTYANASTQFAKNLILEDCFGYSILLRTSGFANFAADSVAKGNGDIIVIVDRYNDDLQLKIRSFNEVKMSGSRCGNSVILSPGTTLSKNFDNNSIISGGWQAKQIIGNDTWETSMAGTATDPYAKISNYNGGNSACENWLISPNISFESGSSPTISFDNDANYSGDQLKLMVSTDFDGLGNPNDFTWTDITNSVAWDSNQSGWGFENTGDIDLSAFSGQTIYIAYKYTGSDTDGKTWEVDEIIITG